MGFLDRYLYYRYSKKASVLMKKLTTATQWYGPYSKITTTDDSYICDGCVLPFDVVGMGVISDYDPAVDVRPPTQEQLDTQWDVVRQERNSLLAACDWTQLPDTPADKDSWAAYRQELRDVTNQPDPFAIIWPTAPGA